MKSERRLNNILDHLSPPFPSSTSSSTTTTSLLFPSKFSSCYDNSNSIDLKQSITSAEKIPKLTNQEKIVDDISNDHDVHQHQQQHQEQSNNNNNNGSHNEKGTHNLYMSESDQNSIMNRSLETLESNIEKRRKILFSDLIDEQVMEKKKKKNSMDGLKKKITNVLQSDDPILVEHDNKQKTINNHGKSPKEYNKFTNDQVSKKFQEPKVKQQQQQKQEQGKGQEQKQEQQQEQQEQGKGQIESNIQIDDINENEFSIGMNVEKALEDISHMVKHAPAKARSIVLSKLLPLIPDDLSLKHESSLTRRAYRLLALSYYIQQKYIHALAWFRKITCTSSHPYDWFNLSCCAAQIRNQSNQEVQSHKPSTDPYLRMALSSFATLEDIHKENKYKFDPMEEMKEQKTFVESVTPSVNVSFWIQLFWFILSLLNGGHLLHAVEMLGRLTKAYKRARFTDDDYLRDFGLPSFDDYLSLVASVFMSANKKDQCIQFLKNLKSNVDSNGSKSIDRLLRHISE